MAFIVRHHTLNHEWSGIPGQRISSPVFAMIWAKATTHGMKTQEGNLCKPASGACQGRHSTPNSGQFNKAQEKGAMCQECKWWRSWFSRPVPWKFTPVGHWTVKLHYQMLSFFSNESPWGEEAPVWKVEVFFQPDLTVLKVTSPWFTMHLLTTIHTHTHTHTHSLSLSLSLSLSPPILME